MTTIRTRHLSSLATSATTSPRATSLLLSPSTCLLASFIPAIVAFQLLLFLHLDGRLTDLLLPFSFHVDLAKSSIST